MKKLFVFWVLLFIFTIPILAQSANDTLFFNDEENRTQIGNNLDSVLNLYYVKNSVPNNQVTSVFVDNQTEIPDSIYIQRLQKIPSLIPMTYNEIVGNYIKWYVKRGKYTIPVMLGMSEYYFPIFEQILDANDMPLELKYLPIIESALNPRAVSRAGAVGLWQFLYGTGKMYDLEINSFVDERRDPLKSSLAAAAYLKDLYNIYGDWHLAIAAYNSGPGNVNRAIKRAKGKANYWEIYPYLPRETRAYVPAFIAATYIMNYYKEHNLVPVKINMPIQTDTIMINKQIHLQQITDIMKIPYEQLRDLNPQYKKDVIPGLCGSYPLRLPMEFSAKFVELEDSIAKHKDTIYLNPQRIITPPDVKESKYAAYADFNESYTPPPTAGKSVVNYTVKSGDTYGFIANWFDVKVADIKYWNNAYSNTINVGQKLTIYVPTKKLRTYQGIEQMSFDQKQKMLSDKIVTASKNTNQVLDNSYIYYSIQNGDNISTIAKKYPGVTEQDIIKINGFTSEDVRRLQINQTIKIKKK